MKGDAVGQLQRARPQTLALGFWLASRGLGARVALGLTLGLAAAGAAAAFWLVRHGASTLAAVPTVTAYALTWGAGLSLAAAASIRAPYRDAETGVLAFLLARGATLGEYVLGRVGGLMLWIALCVGSGTLVAIAGTLAAAHPTEAVWRSSAGALVYSLAFCVMASPVAMATLGARARLRGYLALLLVVVVPDLAASWTERQLLPEGWSELASLPAALGALRAAALASPDLLRTARALAGLTAVVAVSLVVVTAHAARAAERSLP
jgi:hypothetical protein